MRASAFLIALSILLGARLHAQQAPRFHPGQWEVDTVQTVAGGRNITSQTQLCANHQIDFWKVAQAGLTCKTPKTDPVSGGQRVRVHCTYNEGPLHSEIHTVAVEQIEKDGNSFTLTGTTTTDTVYQGVQPKRTSADIKASAHRLGNCH